MNLKLITLLKNQNLIVFTFLTAFCSLFYELLFSQVTAIVIGSTIFSYQIGMGVFVLSLGTGSIICDKLPSSLKSLKALYLIEIALSLLGMLGGVATLFLAKWTSHFPFFIQLSFLLFPIFCVGFLSGIELPLLMKQKQKTKAKLYILGIDFIGMFFAALLFPLFFFKLGLLKTGLIIAFINLIVAHLIHPQKTKWQWFFFFASGVLVLLLWIFNSQLKALIPV